MRSWLSATALIVGLVIPLFVAAQPDSQQDAPAQRSAAVTQDEVADAFVAAQKAMRVAQIKLELMKQTAAREGRTAPVAVVPVEQESSALREIRDAATPIFMAGVLAFLGIVAKNLPAAMRALDAWIQLRLTTHQQGRVDAAAQTAAGVIETQIDRGAMTVADVSKDNSKVRQIVSDAMEPVKESALAQGATVDSMVPVVIGRVDTGRK